MFGCCSHSSKRHSDFFKKFKVETENQGDRFVITLTGSTEDVAKLEKKHKAFLELCGGDDGCCC